MRIATWPVNGISARMPYLVHWLKSRCPDVVALQKICGMSEVFAEAAVRRVERDLKDAGYRLEIYRSGKPELGVAVLVRDGTDGHRVVARGLPGRKEDGERLLAIEWDGLVLASVYVPHVRKKRIGWLRDLEKFAGDLLGRSCHVVVCGDFNVNDRIATVDEKRCLANLEDTGLVDLYRRHCGDDEGFNFGRKKEGPMTARLNRMFGSAPVAADLECAFVDRDYRKEIRGNGRGKWTLSAPLVVDVGCRGDRRRPGRGVELPRRRAGGGREPSPVP